MPTQTELLGAFLALAVTLALLLLRHAARRARARRYDRLKVLTFANHKGGVGKTTTAFFVARELAAQDAERQVLVVDCSIYGDITRLLLGGGDEADTTPLVAAHKTLEDFADAVHARETAWTRRLRPAVKAGDYVARVADYRPTAPKNLHVMTSRAQWLNGPGGAPGAGPAEHGLEDAEDGPISFVAQALRASLGGDEAHKEWVVLCDTDGGLLHGLTKLALCAADSVVVPANADTADTRRLRVMLRYMEGLRQGGLSTATVGLVFFNGLQVKASGPSPDCRALGLAFTVSEDVRREMERLRACLEALRTDFPELLEGMQGERGQGPEGEFFAGVRHGGVTMQRVKDAPFEARLSDAVAGDFQDLSARVSCLLAARRLRFT